jgi:5-deoxy-glucuronate isomerase
VISIFHFKNEDFEGIKKVFDIGQYENNFLGLDIIKLKENSSVELQSDKFEAVLVVQEGICEIRINNQDKITVGKRMDVFEGKAEAVYIPDGDKVNLFTKTKFTAVFCKAKSNKKGNCIFIPSEKIFVETRGASNWKREVHTIIGQDFPSERIVVGETFNKSGCWSGIPPHKHDKQNLPWETYTEEAYLFRTKPKNGFGIFRIYDESEKYDELYTVKDEDIVFFEKGYHPVVGVPGCRLYYLWLMAGERKEIKSVNDSNYNWLSNMEYVLNDFV